MENVKSTWSLDSFFKEVRESQKMPDGSICLTKDIQEHLVKLVEHFSVEKDAAQRFYVMQGQFGPFVLEIKRAHEFTAEGVKHIKSFTDKKSARDFIQENYCKTTKTFKNGHTS